MSASERRQIEKEMIREKILAASSKIIALEGYDKLSIRKIANRVEYSPGVIYHYFKDKAEIVTFISKQGYSTILEQFLKTPIDLDHPEKTLESSLRAYIQIILENPNQFKANIINNIENIHEPADALYKVSSEQRQSIERVGKLIELGISSGKFRPLNSELTAQIIWASTFGLVAKLILEEQLSIKQQEELINHHFEILIRGLLP